MSKPAIQYRSIEAWNTKHGKSIRVVTRSEGKFVDNVSINKLLDDKSPLKQLASKV